MVEQRVLALMERATHAEPGSIRPEAPLVGLDGWDSIGIVDFLGTLYDELGVPMTVDELRTFVRVSDIVDRVVGGA